MEHRVELLMSGFVTHDTRRFVVSRPEDFEFEPGQGAELTIDSPEWRDKGGPFTPTCLPGDGVLEFTIKRYPEREGLTDRLHALEAGSRLLMSAPFGSIGYRGPGLFIAAGAGITPFLAILRRLAAEGGLTQDHGLLFSNKTAADLICGPELKHYLGDRALFTFTREQDPGHEHHRVNAAFLKAHMGDPDRFFYVCGPDAFVKSVNADLVSLGVHPDHLVYEQ
ncbi:MAG: flavodoxin reductase [Chromatiales bacterium]